MMKQITFEEALKLPAGTKARVLLDDTEVWAALEPDRSDIIVYQDHIGNRETKYWYTARWRCVPGPDSRIKQIWIEDATTLKTGNMVLVRNKDSENWSQRIFIAHIPHGRVICVNQYCASNYDNLGEEVRCCSWNQMKPIEQTLSGKKCTVTIDGKEYTATID